MNPTQQLKKRLNLASYFPIITDKTLSKFLALATELEGLGFEVLSAKRRSFCNIEFSIKDQSSPYDFYLFHGKFVLMEKWNLVRKSQAILPMLERLKIYRH